MVSVKVGIDGYTSRCFRHQEHTRHYGMVASLQRYFYRLGQGELCTLIVVMPICTVTADFLPFTNT